MLSSYAPHGRRPQTDSKSFVTYDYVDCLALQSVSLKRPFSEINSVSEYHNKPA